MNRFRWVMVCVVAVVGVAGGCSQKVDLRFNYDPGDYVMTHGTTMNITTVTGGRTSTTATTIFITMDMNMSAADQAGNREMTITYRHVKLGISQNGLALLVYDSATVSQPQDRVSWIYATFIGKTISMTLDSRGNGSNVRGIDELLDAMLVNVPADERTASFRKSVGDDFLEDLSLGPGYPDHPVARGDSWKADMKQPLPGMDALRFQQTCTLQDIQNGVATVSLHAAVTDDNTTTGTADSGKIRAVSVTIDGTMYMDIATGLATRTTMTQKGTILVPAADGNDTHMTFDGKIDLTTQKGKFSATKP